MLNNNEFGILVRAYRKQRGWTQSQLADHWGYTRAYVSLIEQGHKHLDNVSQVIRLADLLGIPQEKLEAIGKGIPKRQADTVITEKEVDNTILQMLLAPGRDMVQMAYMLWVADQHPVLEEKLIDLTQSLDQALTSYHGEFMKPAQQLLAYTHQMRGRIAFDRLDFAAASGHFSEMIDLGNELNDADIIAIGMIYQGSILRKRGRFETSLRCFEAAKNSVKLSSSATQGTYYLNLSTLHADASHEKEFLVAVGIAADISQNMKEDIVGLANDFSLDDVLWAQAGGFSELWKPNEAIAIYAQTDRIRPFRPLRELGAYTIDKGEAFLKAGELEHGIALSLKGIEMASEYRSKRHLGWINTTYNRLRLLPIGKDKRFDRLKEALEEAHLKQASW